MILPASQAIPVHPAAETFYCRSDPVRQILISRLTVLHEQQLCMNCLLVLNDTHLNTISTWKTLRRTEERHTVRLTAGKSLSKSYTNWATRCHCFTKHEARQGRVLINCSVSKEKHANTGAQGRQSRMTASLRITRGVGDCGQSHWEVLPPAPIWDNTNEKNHMNKKPSLSFSFDL